MVLCVALDLVRMVLPISHQYVGEMKDIRSGAKSDYRSQDCLMSDQKRWKAEHNPTSDLQMGIWI